VPDTYSGLRPVLPGKRYGHTSKEEILNDERITASEYNLHLVGGLGAALDLETAGDVPVTGIQPGTVC
jgi:hypothetical protein